MSEKKSRVSKYYQIHVDADEFKKQVMSQDKVERLNAMAQNVVVKNEEVLVDVNKEATTTTDMQIMEEFASDVKHANQQVFILDAEEAVDDSLEDSFEESEEVADVLPVEEGSITAVLEDLKQTVKEDLQIAEVEQVEPEVVDKGEVAIVEHQAVDIKEEKEVVKKKKTAKERWYNFGVGFFTFCNICALICFFVAYGPFHYVRDLFVTTAMRTMSKKYLANVLYSTETIQEILATNVTIEPNEIMDANAISIGNIEEPEVYSSIYEEQVLKKDEGNDLYKVIRLDENGYKGYITFIYDPTKIQLSVTPYLGQIGLFVTDHAKRNNAHVAINAGGFVDIGGNGSGGHPTGYVIQNGKIVWSRKRSSAWGGGTIGFTQDGVLVLTKKQGKAALSEGIYNGVDFGPFLIVNGKSAEVSGNGGWGVHPRTVIGQRQDGIVVFLTVDGRSTKSLGIDLNTAIDIMKRYDVYNAANMDGGASTVLAIEGKLMNHPVAYSSTGEREVPTAWIVVDE